MLVGIPTGVKVFNWVFTMYRGRVRYELPMLWALLALFLPLVGGMTGMMNAFASNDYMWHNGLFVVAPKVWRGPDRLFVLQMHSLNNSFFRYARKQVSRPDY